MIQAMLLKDKIDISQFCFQLIWGGGVMMDTVCVHISLLYLVNYLPLCRVEICQFYVWYKFYYAF